MKDRYDFSKGKRGRGVQSEPEPEVKVRITIRLDQDIVDRFFGWRKHQAVGPDIRHSSTPRFGNTLTVKRHGLKIRCGVLSVKS